MSLIHTLNRENLFATGLVFLDRCEKDIDNTQHLLKWIRRQMQCIRRNHLEWTFLRSLRIGGLLPGGLRKPIRNPHTIISACLSNMGVCLEMTPLPRNGQGLLQAGNVELDRLEFAPPIRYGMQLALLTSTYAGRMRLSLHHDVLGIPREEAQRLLSALVDRLRLRTRKHPFPVESNDVQ
jgi:hypothetical protein